MDVKNSIFNTNQVLLAIDEVEREKLKKRNLLPEKERIIERNKELNSALKELDYGSFSNGYGLFRRHFSPNLPNRKVFDEIKNSLEQLEKLRMKSLTLEIGTNAYKKNWRDLDRMSSIHSDWVKTIHVIINTVLVITKHVLDGKEIEEIVHIHELSNYHTVLKSISKQLDSQLSGTLFLFNQYRNTLMHMDSAEFFNSVVPSRLQDFKDFFSQLEKEITKVHDDNIERWKKIDRIFHSISGDNAQEALDSLKII